MKVLWLDCETSGLDPDRHGIISLAYEVEIDGEVKEGGELFSNCEGKEIDDQALAVNLMTQGQIAKFPPPIEMWRTLTAIFNRHVDKYNHLDKFYGGGFNVEFDMNFLRRLWKDQGDKWFGSWFHSRTIDPSTVIPFLRYAGYLPDFPAKARLVETAQYFGVMQQGMQLHEATVDCKLTRAVSKKLAGLMTGAIPWEQARWKL